MHLRSVVVVGCVLTFEVVPCAWLWEGLALVGGCSSPCCGTVAFPDCCCCGGHLTFRFWLCIDGGFVSGCGLGCMAVVWFCPIGGFVGGCGLGCVFVVCPVFGVPCRRSCMVSVGAWGSSGLSHVVIPVMGLW